MLTFNSLPKLRRSTFSRPSLLTIPALFLLVITTLLHLTTTLAVTVNYTLTDVDSVILYTPSIGTESWEGWNISYSDSPWSTWETQAIGIGQSSHYTTYMGASLNWTFVGTAVYAFGSAGEGAISATVDGNIISTVDQPNGLLTSTTGLSYGQHILVITVEESSGVTVTGFTLTTTIGDSGDTLVNTTLSGVTTDNDINPLVTATGCIAATESAGTTNYNISYPRIDCLNAPVYIDILFGTAYLILIGDSNSDHASYSVTLTPSPPYSLASVLDGYNSWLGLGAVMYMAPLDPTVHYTCELSTVHGDWISFVSAVFVSVIPGADDSSDAAQSLQAYTTTLVSASSTITPLASATSSSVSAATTGSIVLVSGTSVAVGGPATSTLAPGSYATSMASQELASLEATYFLSGTPTLSSDAANSVPSDPVSLGSSDSSDTNLGQIVGCTFAVMAALIASGWTITWLIRRRIRRRRETSHAWATRLESGSVHSASPIWQ